MSQNNTSLYDAARQPLDEAGIKALVLRELLKMRRIGIKSIIANEYSLRRLRVRADLAIYGRKFIGVEIKSAFDRTTRLEQQICAYQKLFDETILVLASKHLSRFPYRDLPLVEVWEVTDCGCIKTHQIPDKPKLSKIAYLNFMTESEIKRFVSTNSNEKPRSGSRREFLKAFRRRFGATSELFWASTSSSSYQADLPLLSRFRSDRERAKIRLASEQSRWEQWLNDLAQAHLCADQSLQASSVSYSPGSSL